ncbi:DUF4007 family protein [Paraburkholderia sp.]|uniref:DUF4007 family protein n=1 Tax=Paraburkholderia sp. TaxID=1926495 RepID=UPI0025D9118F|nr:DUF4007 family protein [Paraburkholderia sp.]
MALDEIRTERFSGHESFSCRYGWLPKIYEAVTNSPAQLETDDLATQWLGIGRNMVRSIWFWAEATEIINIDGQKRTPGRLGRRLLDPKRGWDKYLERLESTWMLHWALSFGANLAAWNCVFGTRRLTYFTRSSLRGEIRHRARSLGKTLVDSTIDQHIAVFLSSYVAQPDDGKGSDDSVWSPFQELNLIQQRGSDNGEIIYSAEDTSPLGLTARAYLYCVRDYWLRHFLGQRVVAMSALTSVDGSPGCIFRLSDEDSRQLLYGASALTGGEVALQDTMDTQNVIADWSNPEVTALIGVCHD